MAATPTTPSSAAPLMLSVSGARGLVGRSMTPAVAADFAAAYGSFVRERAGGGAPLVCVGRDSRPSGPMLEAAAVAGLLGVGCRVVQLGVVATPTVGVMIGAHGADAGMVLTASHNPIEWNGLKCLTRDSLAPPPADAEAIIARFRERVIAYVPVEAIQRTTTDDAGHVTHVERVLECVDVDAIRATGFRVVLDSVNGAGCVAGRMLLERLGCDVVHLNGEPTGHFAHTPEPTAENLVDLASRTRAEGGACGFAQDPDADRLAIVDERGRYIGEEYTLVLAARRVLELRGGGMMAANLSTSRMIDDLAAGFDGATVQRTAVGEAHVAGALKAAGDRAIVGGEGNGGVIYPPVCWVRDSLSAMALVLGLLAAHGRKLGDLVDEMPSYSMVKKKMDLDAVGGRDGLDAALTRLRDHFAGARINDADGVRVDVDDAWVHLRPSNTEPIVRLIGEAPTPEQAESLIAEAAEASGLAG